MGKQVTIACFMLSAIFQIGAAMAQKAAVKPALEPTFFSEDMDPNPFWDSDPLPGNVIDLLRTSKEAASAKDELKGLDRAGFAALFEAIQVHLGNSRDIGYVVVGKFPMSGADCDWFWIVRSDGDHPKIILFSNSNDIELLRGRTNGYRNLRSSWYSAAGYSITCVYHYNGSRYQLVHRFEKRERRNQ